MKFSKACSLAFLSLASTDAFAPTGLQVAQQKSSALRVSVVSEFLTKEEAETKINMAFETETPKSVGIEEVSKSSGDSQLSSAEPQSKRGRRRNRRKHNFAQKKKFLEEKPDTDFYTLHSSAISHLQKDMPINDIIRAIKRAQNLHDVHDLGTIAAFLMDECDEHWGYGFRGSLLSRLAVASLHMNEIDIANRAINTRRRDERPSMQPYESAAIVRGLMRVNKVDKAWIVLEDELRLPLEGSDLSSETSKEMLKHRAQTLASIATRHLFKGEPYVAAQALQSLGSLGRSIDASHMEDGELDMPWSRLINAASDCRSDAVDTCEHVDSSLMIPSDLSELVFEAMSEFPCPSGEDECSIEDFLEG